MRLVIQDDADAVATWVSEYIVDRINAFKPTPTKPFVIGLPTGSSPIDTYKKLVQAFNDGRVSFKNVITFNMDEYCNLDPKHPESYHAFMWRHLFQHIDINPANVNILDGMAPDLQGECDKFEAKIAAVGGIELFLGGIGSDGHMAFNEPGSSLSSRTRVKTLAYDTILANSRFFGNDLKLVPKMALTVGVGTIMSAREVVIIITGAHKAHALHKCIEEGVNFMWTVSALQQHQRACVVCDEDATLELKVKTVKYFKGIQETQEKVLGIPMEGYAGRVYRTPRGAAPAMFAEPAAAGGSGAGGGAGAASAAASSVGSKRTEAPGDGNSANSSGGRSKKKARR